MPGIADNALVKAARLIERLGELAAEPRLTPETEGFLAAIADGVAAGRRRARGCARCRSGRRRDGRAAPRTDGGADDDRGVAEAERDPGPLRGRPSTAGCFRARRRRRPRRSSREWLGEGDYELEWRDGQGGTRSPLGTPLWAAIEEFVARLEPGARLAPICVAGFTDSHWLREAFGTVAYGFFPLRAMSAEMAARLIHSADERIPVDDLELGVEFLRFVAQAIGTRCLSGRASGVLRTCPSQVPRPPPHCEHSERIVACPWRGCHGCVTAAARRGRVRSRTMGEQAREPIRLGGMALQNGVLVHGPTAWAVAVRTDDGELKVASGRKQLRGGGSDQSAAPRARLACSTPSCCCRGSGGPAGGAAGRSSGRSCSASMVGERGRRPAPAGVAAARAGRQGARRRRSLARSRRCSRCAGSSSPPTTVPSTSRSAATSTASRAARSTSAAART